MIAGWRRHRWQGNSCGGSHARSAHGELHSRAAGTGGGPGCSRVAVQAPDGNGSARGGRRLCRGRRACRTRCRKLQGVPPCLAILCRQRPRWVLASEWLITSWAALERTRYIGMRQCTSSCTFLNSASQHHYFLARIDIRLWHWSYGVMEMTDSAGGHLRVLSAV